MRRSRGFQQQQQRRHRSRSPLFSKFCRQQARNAGHFDDDGHQMGYGDDGADWAEQRYTPEDSFSSSHHEESHHHRFYSEGPSHSHEGGSSSIRHRLGEPLGQSVNSRQRTKSVLRVKEFVNDEIFIMEQSEMSSVGHYPPIFVHRSALYFPRGDNSGFCDRFEDYPGMKVSEFIKLGQVLSFEGEDIKNGDCILDLLALKVWPSECSEPESNEVIESNQRFQLRVFLDNFDRRQLAFATVSTISGSRMGNAHAIVSKIVTDKYGVIEIRGLEKGKSGLSCLRCLFHYDSVWLENGDNAREALGYTKVLKDLVHVGMEVNVSARSIIKYKGNDIVESKLELQAILVFVRSSGMPACMPKATRIKGPPGSIGFSPKYTPYFFNSSLLYTLNNQLSEFINITKEVDPLIERTYLNPSVDLELLLHNKDRRLKRDSSGQPNPSIRMDIIGSKGVVVCLFEPEDEGGGGVIECLEGGEKCYFSRESLLKREDQNFREVCAHGKVLSFHASLVDLHSQVPYLTSIMWNEEDFPSQSHKSNHDPYILRKFERVNKNLPEDYLFPQHAENASGTVFRVLDDNFGLIQWDRNGKLTLFDTCDLCIDDDYTAEKMKKSLKDVLSVNQPLRFHAILINRESEIPYLTSAVWSPNNPRIGSLPPFVDRSQIHSKKISIYEVVLKSIVDKLFPRHQDERKGRVSTILTVDNVPVGGILSTYEGDSWRKAFFAIDDSFQKFPPGSQVRYIDKSSSECPLRLGICVHRPHDFNPGIKSHNEEIALSKTLARWSELDLDNNLDWNDLPSVYELPSQRPEDLADSATLVCMINKDSGVLQNNDDPSKLCYFELEDVNFESLNDSITLKDLGTLLGNEIPGIQVVYQSSRPQDAAHREHPIQFIANRGGVQVSTTSPLPSFIRLREPLRSFERDLRTPKLSRWRYANKIFIKNEVMSLERILRGEYQFRRDSESGLPELLIASRGIVKHILNENFGIVQDNKSGAFCLFDTYDIYVSPRVSAADANKSVGDVVRVKDEVEFNATLISISKRVSYLVTGLWGIRLSEDMGHIAPVALSTIQEDKINVYETVSNSCVKMLSNRSHHLDEVDTRQILERKEYIQKAYDSESYIKYSSSLPKSRRSSRDPRTPDPEYVHDDPNDLIRWREEIVDWLSEQLNRTAVYEPPSHSSSAFHMKPEILYEHETTGKLFSEDGTFGIIRLDNEDRALLHRGRVWLTNRPLESPVDMGILIRKNFFRKLHVKAHLLPPGLQEKLGVKYQVIYCFSGINLKRNEDGMFHYNDAMLEWMDVMRSEHIMEREIDDYIRYLSSKRMNR